MPRRWRSRAPIERALFVEFERVRLLKHKLPQSEVAKRLGVSCQTVNVWARRLDDAGGGWPGGVLISRTARQDAGM